MENKKTKKSVCNSIRTKLIVYYSFLFVVILFSVAYFDIKGLPFTNYSGDQGQLRDEAVRGLNLIADLKKGRLLRWLEERHDDIHVVSENAFTSSVVVELLGEVDKLVRDGDKARQWGLLRENERYKNLVEYLNNISSAYGVYEKMHIADMRTGQIFISTDYAELGTNISDKDGYKRALKTRDQHLSDIVLDTHNHPVMDFNHVILDKDGEIVAILLMAINTDDMIKPILHTGEGLGARGEALLVNKEVKILTSLKHTLANRTEAKPLQYKIEAKPAVLAASGKEGVIETVDYRGEPVLAAYRYIPVTDEWGWGMVVKRDTAELFAPMRQNMVYSFLIGVIGVFAFIGLAIVLSKNLTRPIESLSRTATKVADGDLDARAPVTTNDEVGSLSQTFNSMIERIQNWRKELEEQVKERTSELSETNEELKIAKEEAERANEAKSQFLSSMSHELRTPMNAILGFAQLLESDTVEPLSESQLENMKQILKSGRHLLQLINEVLNLSRIESGRLSVSMGSVAVNPLIRDVIAIIEPMTRERGIKFKEPSKKHPDYYIRADPMCIKQVLLNFMSNAVKYNKVGGSVSISCEELPEKMMRIKVTDTGPGIPKEKVDQLFKPFDRLGAEATEIEGTGIGLTIAKRLMELMEGKLGVESTPGEGSCFYADFAIVEKPVLEKVGVLSKSIPTVALQESDRKNLVLCIDDDHTCQALIKNILKLRPNISLLYASQSQLGIDLACSHRPDLILLDINMPDMDGYDVLKRLKTNNETQNIPVFAVSGNAMPHDIEKGTDAGFVRYITKPFDVFELVQAIDIALGLAPDLNRQNYKHNKKRAEVKVDLKTANT